MESSGGNYHHPGAQDEPFFDLLQQGAPISAPKTGHSNNSAYNAPKKMENSSDFNFAGGDDVLPNFDFQPIRTSAASSSSSNASGASSTAARIEEGGGRQGSPPASYTSYEPMVRRSREPPPTYETPVSRAQEHEKESFDSATAAAVERTMKKYADNLLRVLEGLTGRLAQLESSTQRLEHLFAEIKIMVGETHGEADGKLRSLESHILEVHRGVQVLRDRQEIFEAQSQLAKLQLAKGESAVLHSEPSAPPPPPPPPPPGSNAPSQLSLAPSGKALLEAPPQHQAADTPSSSYYQPQPQLQLQQMPSLPAPPPQQPRPPPPPPPPPQQQQQQGAIPQPQQQQHQVQPQQQLQQQAMQLQQPNEVSHHSLHQQPPPPQPQPPQRLSLPPQHQPPPPHAPHPPPPYPQQQQQQQQQQQPPYPQQQQQSSQPPPPMPNYGHPSELPPYGQHPQGPHPPHPHHVPHQPPPSSYPSDLPGYHPSYGHPRPGMPPPQQQPPPSPQPQQPHNAGMYEPSMGRAGSGQLSLPAPPYVPQGHPGYEPQGMNPGSGYPGSAYRVAQPVPSAPSGSSGSGGYPRLPVAQPVPHALPTSGSGSGPPSSGNPSVSANRVPIDEVIDKVTAMGFSKSQVRDVVRRLTENGQSVDLNIVLDKLMNGENPAQAPPKGWFGR